MKRCVARVPVRRFLSRLIHFIKKKKESLCWCFEMGFRVTLYRAFSVIQPIGYFTSSTVKVEQVGQYGANEGASGVDLGNAE
jgi:hypothetical protein